MSAFLVNRSVLHYETVGRGKPVIFLHNFIGSWRYWIPVMDVLSAGFKCYAYDLWGYGDSAKDPAMFSLESHVNQLQQFMEQLGIQQAALVGHGYGALVAQYFASRYPLQVSRMVSIHHHIPTVLRKDQTQFQTHTWLSSQHLPEAVALDCQKAAPGAVVSAFASLIEASDRTDDSDAEKTMPHLVIQYGEHSGTASKSGRVVISKQTFFPMAQNPEELNRLLHEFLAGTPIALAEGVSVKEFWKRRVR